MRCFSLFGVLSSLYLVFKCPETYAQKIDLSLIQTPEIKSLAEIVNTKRAPAAQFIFKKVSDTLASRFVRISDESNLGQWSYYRIGADLVELDHANLENIHVGIIDGDFDRDAVWLKDRTAGSNLATFANCVSRSWEHGTHVCSTIAMQGELAAPGGLFPKFILTSYVSPSLEKKLPKRWDGRDADPFFQESLTEQLEHILKDSNVRVVSASLKFGLNGGWSKVIDEQLKGRNILFVNAAGNEREYMNSSASPGQATIFVSALNEFNNLSSFSNHGHAVFISAPGERIESFIGSKNQGRDGIPGEKSGTSMSAPHVSTVAASIWTVKPDFTREEVKEILRRTAIDLGTAGFDAIYGHGMLNAYGAVEFAKAYAETKDYKVAEEQIAKLAKDFFQIAQKSLTNILNSASRDKDEIDQSIQMARRAYFLAPHELAHRELAFLSEFTFGKRWDILVGAQNLTTESVSLENWNKHLNPWLTDSPDRDLAQADRRQLILNLISRLPVSKPAHRWSLDEIDASIQIAIESQKANVPYLDIPLWTRAHFATLRPRFIGHEPKQRFSGEQILHTLDRLNALANYKDKNHLAYVLSEGVYPQDIIRDLTDAQVIERVSKAFENPINVNTYVNSGYYDLMASLLTALEARGSKAITSDLTEKFRSIVPRGEYFSQLEHSLLTLNTKIASPQPTGNPVVFKTAAEDIAELKEKLKVLNPDYRSWRSVLRLSPSRDVIQDGKTIHHISNWKESFGQDADLAKALKEKWDVTPPDIQRKILDSYSETLDLSGVDKMPKDLLQILFDTNASGVEDSLRHWLLKGNAVQYRLAVNTLISNKKFVEADALAILKNEAKAVPSRATNLRLSHLSIQLEGLVKDKVVSDATAYEIMKDSLGDGYAEFLEEAGRLRQNHSIVNSKTVVKVEVVNTIRDFIYETVLLREDLPSMWVQNFIVESNHAASAASVALLALEKSPNDENLSSDLFRKRVYAAQFFEIASHLFQLKLHLDPDFLPATSDELATWIDFSTYGSDLRLGNLQALMKWMIANKDKVLPIMEQLNNDRPDRLNLVESLDLSNPIISESYLVSESGDDLWIKGEFNLRAGHPKDYGFKVNTLSGLWFMYELEKGRFKVGTTDIYETSDQNRSVLTKMREDRFAVDGYKSDLFFRLTLDPSLIESRIRNAKTPEDWYQIILFGLEAHALTAISDNAVALQSMTQLILPALKAQFSNIRASDQKGAHKLLLVFERGLSFERKKLPEADQDWLDKQFVEGFADSPGAPLTNLYYEAIAKRGARSPKFLSELKALNTTGWATEKLGQWQSLIHELEKIPAPNP